MTEKPRRCVSLVRSSCQSSKKELEEPVGFPEGMTLDDLAEAVVQPVNIDWKDRLN